MLINDSYPPAQLLLPPGVKPAPVPVPKPKALPPPPPKRKSKIGGGLSKPLYLGCYSDNQQGIRAVPNKLAVTNPTPDSCYAAAALAGYTLYALANGNECWAGTDIYRAQAQGKSTACTTRCAGDSAKYCGGSNALTLYTTKAIEPPTTTCTSSVCYRSLGCYVETACSGGFRGLNPTGYNQNVGYFKDNTVDKCAAATKAAGFRYFGVQNYMDCYGANTLVLGTSMGYSTACNNACPGDSTQVCGKPRA